MRATICEKYIHINILCAVVVACALKLVYTTDAPHVERGLIQNDFVLYTLYAATLSVYFRNNICSRAGDICAHVGIHIRVYLNIIFCCRMLHSGIYESPSFSSVRLMRRRGVGIRSMQMQNGICMHAWY